MPHCVALSNLLTQSHFTQSATSSSKEFPGMHYLRLKGGSCMFECSHCWGSICTTEHQHVRENGLPCQAFSLACYMWFSWLSQLAFILGLPSVNRAVWWYIKGKHNKHPTTLSIFQIKNSKNGNQWTHFTASVTEVIGLRLYNVSKAIYFLHCL